MTIEAGASDASAVGTGGISSDVGNGDAGAPIDAPAVDQGGQIDDMMEVFGEDIKREDKKDGKDNLDKANDGATKPDKQTDKDDSPAESEEVKTLKEQLAELQETVNNLKNPPAEKKDDIVIDADALKTQIDVLQKDLVSEYIKDDDHYNAIIDDRNKMNSLLKDVQNDTLQGVLRAIPKVISGMVSQQVHLFTKTAEFYKANPDLKAHAQTVGAVIDDVASKNPKLSLDEVLAVVGGDGKDDDGEVRRRLKLKKKAEDKVVVKDEPVRRAQNNARTAHVRQPSGQEVVLSGVEKEIADMLDMAEGT